MKVVYTSTDILKSISAKDEITTDQIKIYNAVISGTQISTTSLQKGNFGEVAGDLAMLSASYTTLHSRISALDEKTHLGIDGVYFTTINQLDVYVIADAKFGRAQLSNTRTGRQLSDRWIDCRLCDVADTSDKPTRLEKAIGSSNARTAVEKIKNGQAILIRILIRISPNGSVTLSLVNRDGYVERRNVSFKDLDLIARKQ